MTVDYTPPTPADLRALKDELGLSGEQMAALFGLAGGQQWRKYTGGMAPREMSMQMLFFGAAHLVLDDATLARVVDRMRALGAQLPDEGAYRARTGADAGVTAS